MKIYDYLYHARKNIDQPEKWTKGAPARLPSYEPTHSFDRDAVCFCIVGALNKERGRGAACHSRTMLFMKNFVNTFGEKWYHISDFNDYRYTTHKDVMRLFDSAIEKAKEENV